MPHDAFLRCYVFVRSLQTLEHFLFGLIPPVSLPGLTRQSSIHGWWLLDRPVKPSDDSIVSLGLIKNA
jgi:hypothetical protein